jgi:peroxiredoxin
MKLSVGERAPGFTLPSHLGMDVSLSQYSEKVVVLAFFPLAWTPV